MLTESQGRKPLGYREFNTAFALLVRLRRYYYSVDDITKAAYMLQYHALKQKESAFVDGKLREHLTQRDIGKW